MGQVYVVKLENMYLLLLIWLRLNDDNLENKNDKHVMGGGD